MSANRSILARPAGMAVPSEPVPPAFGPTPAGRGEPPRVRLRRGTNFPGGTFAPLPYARPARHNHSRRAGRAGRPSRNTSPPGWPPPEGQFGGRDRPAVGLARASKFPLCSYLCYPAAMPRRHDPDASIRGAVLLGQLAGSLPVLEVACPRHSPPFMRGFSPPLTPTRPSLSHAGQSACSTTKGMRLCNGTISALDGVVIIATASPPARGCPASSPPLRMASGWGRAVPGRCAAVLSGIAPSMTNGVVKGARVPGSGGLQDAERRHRSLGKKQAAAGGRNVLVVVGTKAEEVTEFIVAATEPSGRSGALEASHPSVPILDANGDPAPGRCSCSGWSDASPVHRVRCGWRAGHCHVAALAEQHVHPLRNLRFYRPDRPARMAPSASPYRTRPASAQSRPQTEPR